MKKLTGILYFALLLGLSSVAQAQEADDSKVKKEVKEGAKSVKKGAKKAGKKLQKLPQKVRPK
jgi:hypothetical protein